MKINPVKKKAEATRTPKTIKKYRETSQLLKFVKNKSPFPSNKRTIKTTIIEAKIARKILLLDVLC